MSDVTTISEDGLGAPDVVIEPDITTPTPGLDAPEAAEPQEPAPEGEQQQPQRRGLIAELQETRQARREAEERAKRLEETLTRGNERLMQLLAAQRQPAPEPAAIPDINTDPVGHFKAKTEALERELQTVRQPIQAQTQMAQFVNAYAQAANAFRSEAPDFDAAYQHAMGALKADATYFGMSLEQVEAGIVQNAMRQGINPAKAIYDFAKTRGYSAAPKQNAATTVETMQRGAAASQSLGRATGSAPGAITLEALANMSESEFAAINRKNPEAVRRALGG